ncbi:MAG: glycosyltransferase family 4 protein [Bacteroidales bacterium]|nr:glycosyltransferase family 4 protein [Bacteroidales bacterium]
MIASLRMGGAERQLASLAAMLKRAGEDVEVLTYRDGDFYEDMLAEAGVPHIRVRQRGGELLLVSDIARQLKKSGCELLISYLAGTNIKACLAGSLCPGLKLIVSERNCNTSLQLHDRLRFALYRRHADKVVCNSYSQTAFIREHAPALQGRLYTIPNFTDLERFRQSSKNLDGRPFKVVTMARLDSRKNTLGLIRAAAGCPGIEFHWYGAERQDGYYRCCLKLIDALGLKERFLIHPASNNPELVYGTADAFCLPSFYEGTSNSLAEALASGLPAACSRVSDNSRYVVDGRNGFLFDAADPESISAALNKLAALGPEELTAAGRQSRAVAETAFRRDIFIERYLDLIRGPRGGTKRPG